MTTVRYSRPRTWLMVPTFLCAGLILVQPAPAMGQAPSLPQTWDAGGLQLNRAELRRLLSQFEQVSTSSQRSDEFRLRAGSEATLVRRRLEEGDFQVGDQVLLTIEGEQNMPLQLVVAPGRKLILPGLGELSLVGVLRAELTSQARAHITRFIAEPVVRSQSLVRVLVTGQVTTPGYHVLPAESLLSDLIMRAGGPTPTASLGRARFERGTDPIWEGKILQEAFADGRTLDQMSVRSGDRLVIPSDAAGGRSASLLRVVTMVPALVLAITGLLQIF